jgi:hypothetical protein
MRVVQVKPDPVPSKPEADALELRSEAAKAAEGLKGMDLARSLADFARAELDEKGVHDGIQLNREALKSILRYKFPPVPERCMPILMVPTSFKYELNQIPKRGSGALKVDATLDALGPLFVGLADRTLNSYEADKVGYMLADSSIANIADSLNYPWIHQIIDEVTSAEMCIITSLFRNVPIQISRVKVCWSPLHGNGVFATKHIKKGDIVTMYPAHAATLRAKRLNGTYWVLNGKESMNGLDASIFAAYVAEVDGTRIGIAGHPDTHSPSACGHLINDASSITERDFSVQQMLRYVRDSVAGQNCAFVPLGCMALAVVATRAVAPGEEMLTSYGSGFWGRYAVGEV